MRTIFTVALATTILVSPTLAAPDGAVRLTTLTSVSDPTWSPDGTEMAFGYDFDIWVIPVTPGGVPTRISTDTEFDFDPDWSPTGDQIAFFRDADIWGVDPDTGVETPLVATPDDEQYPTWSPTGSRIAYCRRSTGTWELWMTNLTNGSTMPLAQLPGLDILYPSWSPDGRYIAFEVRVPGNEGNISLYEVETGDVIELIHLATHDGRPAWSPSGAWLVFESEREAVGVTDADIWRMPMYDGVAGVAEPLSCSDAFDINPIWSPTGSRIAFLSQRDLVGGQFDIYLFGAGVVDVNEAPGPAPGAAMVAAPNPFRSGTTIRLQVADSRADMALRVVDASGRVVRTLVAAPGRDGVSAWWNGRDARGRRVSPGVYYVRGEGVSARVVHLQ